MQRAYIDHFYGNGDGELTQLEINNWVTKFETEEREKIETEYTFIDGRRGHITEVDLEVTCPLGNINATGDFITFTRETVSWTTLEEKNEHVYSRAGLKDGETVSFTVPSGWEIAGVEGLNAKSISTDKKTVKGIAITDISHNITFRKTPTPTPTPTTPTPTPTPTATPSPTPPSRCLIATATYGSELSPEVQFLRNFRDRTVFPTFAGKAFIPVFNAWYYSFSPVVAKAIADYPLIQAIARILLYPLIGILHLSAATYSILSFNPELAVLVAGLVASSLIGAIYFSPFMVLALLVQGKSKKTLTMRHWKSLTIIWAASLMLILVGEALSTQMAMMVGTSMFVLTTLSLSAMAVGTKIFQIKHRIHFLGKGSLTTP